MTVNTTKLHTFRILHGYKGLDEAVTKWTADSKEDKVMFAYLNPVNGALDITKIAAVVAQLWTDAEGLLVAVQLVDTPVGEALQEHLANRVLSFTMGPIATVHKDGEDNVLDSLSGIYFADK